MTPTRIQLSRRKGWKMPPDTPPGETDLCHGAVWLEVANAPTKKPGT